jgi:hypothetical protein
MGIADDQSCKTLGGVYKNGSTPCSHENLVGTCAMADSSSGMNDVDYFYKSDGINADSMKTLCESVMSGKWTTAPKAAGPAPKAAGAKAAPKAKK